MGYVDFHTHLLPKVDDGSDSVEKSYTMLKKMADEGTEIVFATPHCLLSREEEKTFLARRTAAFENLKAYLEELLNNPAYRITTTDNLYAPFSLEVIDAVIQKLGNASLRKYNETFSRLIEIAAYEGYDEINNANFASLINEIIIWQ